MSVWIYGKHALNRAINNTQRQHRCLYYSAKTANKLANLPNNRIKAKQVDVSFFKQRFGHEPHGELVLETTQAFPKLQTPDHLIERAINHDCKGPFLILDQVTDPQNLGAILRSAAAFGCPGIFLPARHNVSLTPFAVKIASGGADHVPVLKIKNMHNLIKSLQNNGYWLTALSEHAEQCLHAQKLDIKTVFILGSEGKGVREGLIKKADYLVKLPTNPNFLSLNVAHACSLALYHYSLNHG